MRPFTTAQRHMNVPARDAAAAFGAALDSLVSQIRQDRSILAAILGGSLSHDRVWEKSDIDLVLVTVDEKQKDATRDSGVSLYADGMNVHAILLPRAKFRETVEGAIRNSFAHSFLTKGRLLYTHDPTIAELCRTLAHIGARDRDIQLLRAASSALGSPVATASIVTQSPGMAGGTST